MFQSNQSKSINNNEHLTLFIDIQYVDSYLNLKYYSMNMQWSDGDEWNPRSKGSENLATISSSDLMLNLLSTVQLTFCKQITIQVRGDELLKENLKVLTNQSESKRKSQVLVEVAYNQKERSRLGAFFRDMNIFVI